MTQKVNKQDLLETAELAAVEARLPEGISSAEVIELFQARGVKLSEATFRKYIQLGLLPTSRRVGRKGKHRGSRGVYPISVVRRINLIKRLMDEGMTLEEIRDSFLAIQNDIEQISSAFENLFEHVADRLARLQGQGASVGTYEKEIAASRKGARMLLKQIEKLGSRLAVAGPVSAGNE